MDEAQKPSNSKMVCVLLGLVDCSQHFTYTFKNYMKKEAVSSFETLISPYQATQCHISEDDNLNLNCHRNHISNCHGFKGIQVILLILNEDSSDSCIMSQFHHIMCKEEMFTVIKLCMQFQHCSRNRENVGY
jgi:hypothetical protein